MEVLAEFRECPGCKVDAWLMKSIMKIEVVKGNIGADVMPGTMTKVFTNLDTRKPPLLGGRVASARVYYDICCQCGKEHPVRIEKGYVTIPSSPGQVPVFA